MTLLGHYWRDDDPVELTAAIGADWADVLEGLPREIIQRACIAYLRDEPRRKPTPGEIYKRAIALMPRPRPTAREQEEPRRPRMKPERAAEILREVGFKLVG